MNSQILAICSYENYIEIFFYKHHENIAQEKIQINDNNGRVCWEQWKNDVQSCELKNYIINDDDWHQIRLSLYSFSGFIR
ncbi:MAG: hypothetical protein ACRC37_07355 [Lentisphaeria bacterium]